jgi:aromatic ring-opening dioxygenase catalytic subunit (LigB family)
MVYDAYGFPDKLYQLKYSAKGCPEAAKLAAGLIKKTVRVDNSWGIDHGTWSVLKHMYPDADIPVFQLSIDSLAPASAHYRIGQELASLRKQGIMIFGSGNVVHNLFSLISTSRIRSSIESMNMPFTMTMETISARSFPYRRRNISILCFISSAHRPRMKS